MLRLHFLCADLWSYLLPILLLLVSFQSDVAWDQSCSQQWCSSVVQVPSSVFGEISSLMGEPGM